MAEKLGIGAVFPQLTIDLVAGGAMTLPRDLNSKYGIVLFYRGHW